MEVLFEPKCAICPAEPDDLASGGCSDGCELLTGEVCEASWWDGLLNGSESEGPEAGFNGSQHEVSAMVSPWHRPVLVLPLIAVLGAAFPSQVEDKGSWHKMHAGSSGRVLAGRGVFNCVLFELGMCVPRSYRLALCCLELARVPHSPHVQSVSRFLCASLWRHAARTWRCPYVSGDPVAPMFVHPAAGGQPLLLRPPRG